MERKGKGLSLQSQFCSATRVLSFLLFVYNIRHAIFEDEALPCARSYYQPVYHSYTVLLVQYAKSAHQELCCGGPLPREGFKSYHSPYKE